MVNLAHINFKVRIIYLIYKLGVELSSDDETTSSISEEPKPILKAAGGTSDKTNIKEVTYAPAVVFDEEVEDAVEAIEDLFTGDMSSDEEKQRWKDFHEVDSEEFGKTFEEAKDSDRYVTLHPVPHIDLRESRSIQWRRILTRYYFTHKTFPVLLNKCLF